MGRWPTAVALAKAVAVMVGSVARASQTGLVAPGSVREALFGSVGRLPSSRIRIRPQSWITVLQLHQRHQRNQVTAAAAAAGWMGSYPCLCVAVQFLCHKSFCLPNCQARTLVPVPPFSVSCRRRADRETHVRNAACAQPATPLIQLPATPACHPQRATESMDAVGLARARVSTATTAVAAAAHADFLFWFILVCFTGLVNEGWTCRHRYNVHRTPSGLKITLGSEKRWKGCECTHF